MKQVSILVVAAMFLAMLSAGTASAAGCKSNGRVFPVGSVVGSLVCTVNGWSIRGR